MAIIVPAILEDDLDHFQIKLAEILKIPNVKRIQIDFSDGQFTPRRTVNISDVGPLNQAYFWEAHLMVENPSSYFFDARLAGFNNVIIHFEAVPDPRQLSHIAGDLRDMKISAGLAVRPETEIEQIFPYIGFFEQILVLDVYPGYQGQDFLDQTYRRIEKLKKYNENVKLEVDGAVRLSNVKKLLGLGADMLVVGSALAEPAPDFEKFEREIQSL